MYITIVCLVSLVFFVIGIILPFSDKGRTLLNDFGLESYYNLYNGEYENDSKIVIFLSLILQTVVYIFALFITSVILGLIFPITFLAFLMVVLIKNK